MTVFAASVFDATINVDGNDLFKGQGAASMWAEKVGREIGTKVSVKKIGNGWALVGNVDGEECIWGVYGQRIKRIN